MTEEKTSAGFAFSWAFLAFIFVLSFAPMLALVLLVYVGPIVAAGQFLAALFVGARIAAGRARGPAITS